MSSVDFFHDMIADDLTEGPAARRVEWLCQWTNVMTDE